MDWPAPFVLTIGRCAAGIESINSSWKVSVIPRGLKADYLANNISDSTCQADTKGAIRIGRVMVEISDEVDAIGHALDGWFHVPHTAMSFIKNRSEVGADIVELLRKFKS